MAQGTWRVDPGENRELQIESGVDRNKLLGNAKKTAGKRKLPHPKVLSYPVAVTPEENNGSRLLIKCFEYLPPKNILTYGGKTKTAKKKFTDTYGNKYKIGDELLGEDKKPLLYPKTQIIENKIEKKHPKSAIKKINKVILFYDDETFETFTN